MKLSIFVGLRAIGWNITSQNQIIHSGVKKVNVSFDNYYEYIAGQPVSTRINRRLKKQMRRNLWRNRSRKQKLNRLLVKHGISPISEVTGSQINELRHLATQSPIEPHNLYHVLMAMQKKRGYKSLRGLVNSDESEYLQTIQQHEEALKSYPSIGAYFSTLSTTRDVVLMRQTYEQEFDKICQVQNLPDELVKKIRHCIYYQRPLKKQKVSKCKYEQNREVVHASNPIYQKFRIYRDVLNIKIIATDGTEVEIPDEIRENWINLLMNGKNLTKARCLKDLAIKSTKGYSWFSGKQIPGHPVYNAFIKAGIIKEYDSHPIHANFVYNLWQDIFSATDDQKLEAILRKKLNCSEDTIQQLIDLNFQSLGYADYSMKAIRKLLPEMLRGVKLKNAIMNIYGKVNFNEIQLRNVILEQHFDSTKSLIKKLKEEYQHFDEVVIELDQLLKAGNKSRKEMAGNKRKEQKWQKDHADILKNDQYRAQLLKLYEQQKGICPYEPDKIIPMNELFSGKYNIDHIVPKSKIFERGFNNQILCPKHLNEQKGRMTGFEFAQERGILDEYLKVIEEYPESKKKFLLMKEADIPKDYLSSTAASDYNTKCFLTLYPGAYNIPGKLLNYYYRKWKFDKYPDNDIRHALAKSFVLANMSRETITYFDNIAIETANRSSVGVYDILPDITFQKADEYIAQTTVYIPRIKFYGKNAEGYYPKGALHKETIYGLRKKLHRNAKGQIKETIYFKIRQPISKLTPNMVRHIIDGKIKDIIENRLSSYNSHEDDIQSLVEYPPTFNNKPIRAVSIAINSENFIPIHSTNGKGFTGPSGKFNIPCDYVQASNLATTLTRLENGKIKIEVIKLIDYIDQLNNKEGKNLQLNCYLKGNSVIELDGRHYYVLGASMDIQVRSVYDLDATPTIKLKQSDFDKMKILNISQTGSINMIKYVS
jgi:uncharacterized membrane-anchored protein YhcB (DUF1043 family)